MKKLLLMIMVLGLTIVSHAQNDDNTEIPDIDLTTGAHFTVNLPAAGTLKQRLTAAVFETDFDLVDFLTIKGKMGAADIAYLNAQEGLVSQLQYLDLSDVELVYDDGVYFERTYRTDGNTYGGIQTYRSDIYTLSEENKDEAGPDDNYGTGIIVTSTYCRRNDLTYAFSGMKHLKQIKLPKTMKAIGERILSDVENLEKVTLPTAPTHIGDYAFGKKNLKYFDLPESVESLGKYALAKVSFHSIDVSHIVQLGEGCLLQTNITNAQLNSKITSIPVKAFAGCTALTSVVIPGSVETVEEAAFAHSGVRSLTINEGVKKIGKDAFTGCPWLTDVTVANTIEEVGYNAFSGRDLEEYFSNGPTAWFDSQPAEDGVKYIGKVAYLFTGGNEIKIKEGTVSVADGFMKHSFGDLNYVEAQEQPEKITTITLPSTLKIIGDEAFVYTSISSITLPDALEKMGDRTFEDCKKLRRITIPANVTFLGERTFRGTGLVRVNYNAIDAPYPYINYEWGRTGYPEVFPESVTRVIIGEGVKSIPAGLFRNSKNLTRVQMASTVERIEAYAFSGCTSLESIDLPSSLKGIGTDALICGNLQTVTSYLNEPFSFTTDIREDTMREPDLDENGNQRKDEDGTPLWLYYTYVEVTSSTPFGIQRYTYLKDDPNNITDYDSRLPLLKVPNGSLAAYQSDPSWAGIFEKIEEFESASDTEAIAESTSVSVSQSVTDNTDLSGSIVDGIYVTLDTEDSGDGYNTQEGCIVINSQTTAEGLAAATADGADDLTIKNQLQGLIFEVPAGKGKIKVDCQTLGSRVLYVKIGNDEPQKVQLGTRNTITFNYDVAENTRVFIYAADETQSARSNDIHRAAYANDNSVKIYGLTIEVDEVTNKYKLTYKVDGEVYKTYDVGYGATITPEAEPTKEGYTFSGWSEIPEKMPAKDVTITGTFTINKYKLTYQVDGVEYKSIDVEYGSTITPETEPTKEGYTFSGWSNIPATMPAKDVTVTGTFTVNKYKLTYQVDGEVYKTIDVEYGASITPETEPTKEGYTFSGWSNIPATMPAKDVTVSGTFSINKYKLTYEVDGKVYKTYDVEYGATITPEEEPTKEGYTFSGWSEIPAKMPAKDVTITGSFSVNKYKLTYMVDGEVYKTYDVEYGTTITPEPTPTKEGYTFSGWSDIPTTMPAHDVTVSGTFTQETGIVQIMGSENGKAMIFTIDGKRVDNLKKGLNVIRMKDGTIRKAVVK